MIRLPKRIITPEKMMTKEDFYESFGENSETIYTLRDLVRWLPLLNPERGEPLIPTGKKFFIGVIDKNQNETEHFLTCRIVDFRRSGYILEYEKDGNTYEWNLFSKPKKMPEFVKSSSRFIFKLKVEEETLEESEIDKQDEEVEENTPMNIDTPKILPEAEPKEEISKPTEEKKKSKKGKKFRIVKQKKRDTASGRKELLEKKDTEEFARCMNNIVSILDRSRKHIHTRDRRDILLILDSIFPQLETIINSQWQQRFVLEVSGNHEKYFVLSVLFSHIVIANLSDTKFSRIESSLKKIARKLLSSHRNNFISTEAASFISQEDKRTMQQYSVLMFPELFGEINFTKEGYAHFSADLPEVMEQIALKLRGVTLDIGGGFIFTNPLSLMNYINSINPNSYKSLDPDYDFENQSWARRANQMLGKELNRQEIENNPNLIAGYAQNIPLDSLSVDNVLSCWCFDKFNEENQGTLQAIRETARVLKDGGEARIFGLRDRYLGHPEISKYFQAEYVKVHDREKTYDAKQEKIWLVVLRKKNLGAEEKNELERKSNEWKEKYV